MRKPGFYYGYWIVLAAFLCIAVQSGTGFYAFSLFIRPLQAEFGWSRGAISLAFTIWFLLMGLASPFIGRLVDRYGVKKVLFTGALMYGVGFVFLGTMQALWQFYAGYAVLGAGMAATGQVPASAMVSGWFRKRRGMAIGIMSTGIGFGGFALAPVLGGYLIPGFGWRPAYLYLGLIALVVLIPVALFMVKPNPADSNPSSPAQTGPVAPGSLTLKLALATPAFWIIAIAFMLTQIAQVGTAQSQVPHLEDIGFPLALAAGALGAVGLVSGIGKFFFGWLCDLIAPKYALGIGLGLQIVALGLLINLKPESPVALIWLYAALMGLGMGSWLPTMSMLTSSHFGLAYYGAIFGVVSLAQSFGSASGPLLAGLLFDAMQTYRWTFVIFLALLLVSLPAVLLLRRPKGVA